MRRGELALVLAILAGLACAVLVACQTEFTALEDDDAQLTADVAEVVAFGDCCHWSAWLGWLAWPATTTTAMVEILLRALTNNRICCE